MDERSAHRGERACHDPSMSATSSPTTPAITAEERALRRNVLRAILVISAAGLVMLIALVYGMVAGVEWISPVFGPIHGAGVIAEFGLIAYGVWKGWWGQWYFWVTLVTTGPPGALLGHGKASREALGA